MSSTFAILSCGHWIVDPHGMLLRGGPGPCPKGDGQAVVIALAEDPSAEFYPGIEVPK